MRLWEGSAQNALNPNQSAFLSNACACVRGFTFLFTGILEPDHIATIGAMAFARHLCPYGPGMQARAEALLRSLLQLPATTNAPIAAPEPFLKQRRLLLSPAPPRKDADPPEPLRVKSLELLFRLRITS